MVARACVRANDEQELSRLFRRTALNQLLSAQPAHGRRVPDFVHSSIIGGPLIPSHNVSRVPPFFLDQQTG